MGGLSGEDDDDSKDPNYELDSQDLGEVEAEVEMEDDTWKITQLKTLTLRNDRQSYLVYPFL